MTGRALSSVLDVSICLLLVSASAVTLTQVPQEPANERPERADDLLELLTTSTAWIEYSPRRIDERPNQTAHGTLAELLAAGAVSNATVHDRSIAHVDSFRRAVAIEVRRATDIQDQRVQVVAEWRPYPAAHVSGHLVVGPSPPPSADVHAALTTVPRGSSNVRHRTAAIAPTRSFSGVASVVADGLIRGPFSSGTNRVASDPPAVSNRPRRGAVASAYGLQEERVAADELHETVASDVEADLRNRYDSPDEAAGAITFGRVRLIVRTWSP